ncbi:MAG: transporter [Akkermansiaceae bacterium]|jgi:hypothetical protein|nr:transporter [Akkermansiaceae bacterium]MCU0778146.1 transporter [Akkermansiaceae bacterium]
MKTPVTSKAILFTITTCAILIPLSHAEEGGSGHVVPGGKSTLIDLLPTKPGWVFEAVYLHYEGDAEGSVRIPTAGLLTLGLDASSDALSLGGFHTFEQPLWGAYYSIGAMLPYVWTDVDARITLGPFGAKGSSSVDGIGDLCLMPLLMAWKPNECWQIDASLPVYAPTGDYDAGRLANPGLNHWTFDPTIAAGYSNEKTGFNFATHAGFAFSTENNDTDYRNGTVFHLDASAQQLLPVGNGLIGLGVEGFYQQQITDDKGAGATLGGFRGRTVGIGPVLSYILPLGDSTLVAEARWLPELDTKNRLEGDYFWLKFVYQF